MAFNELRLFDCVSFGFVSGPEWRTLVVTRDNGSESRNREWSRARMSYSVPFNNIRVDDYQTILAAFYVCGGRADGFRFKDWDDYQATAEVIGVTPSGSTPVQLVKTYLFGAQSYTRLIKKPVAGTVTVYQNGAAKAGTLDTTTGLFTPTTPWTGGAALTWTGEFDVPVRFDIDYLPATWDNYKVRSMDIPMVELK